MKLKKRVIEAFTPMNSHLRGTTCQKNMNPRLPEVNGIELTLQLYETLTEHGINYTSL